MFARLEAALETFVHNVTGETAKEVAGARDEVETALADLKTRVARVGPLLTAFEGDLKTALADVTPELKTAAESLLSQLLADAGELLGDNPAGM